MKKKLTAADMHDPQVIAETPWFSMRKVGLMSPPASAATFIPFITRARRWGLWLSRMRKYC